MSKEEIFAIIDDELEKRKDHTFLLWDFPNDVKKRIEELYQSIDNANPSEAMESLEKVNDYLNNVYDYKEIKEEIQKDVNTIKQALLKAQEQGKVLNIIKEKNVNLEVLGISNNVNCYNKVIVRYSVCYKELTQEEFDLLKRWSK